MRKALERQAKALLILFLLSSVLFSAFFLAEESRHHCDDKDCIVCHVLTVCRESLRLGGEANLTLSLLLLPLPEAGQPALLSKAQAARTPVSVHDRMDDG